MTVWDRTFGLNLKGTYLWCRHVIPRTAAAGGGSVINMSSIVALKGNFPTHICSSAKGGVLSLTRSPAGAHAAEGVR